MVARFDLAAIVQMGFGIIYLVKVDTRARPAMSRSSRILRHVLRARPATPVRISVADFTPAIRSLRDMSRPGAAVRVSPPSAIRVDFGTFGYTCTARARRLAGSGILVLRCPAAICNILQSPALRHKPCRNAA